ncbi:hypothetical protein GCM10010869_50850 [Mesorhizobium tianshanense]|nr:hypothetical protein GCM10010869_50850 [Mesorhizobium tianshanense]
MAPEQVTPFRLTEAIANDDDIDALFGKQGFGLPRLPHRAHVMTAPFEMVGEIGRNHFGDRNKRDDGSCSHLFPSPATGNPR